jgi:hypothetical protein
MATLPIEVKSADARETHAWQIRAKSFVPGLACDRLTKTSACSLALGENWADMGMGQQAFVVDDWFKRYAAGWTDIGDLKVRLGSQAAIRDPSFAHIASHVRLGVN